MSKTKGALICVAFLALIFVAGSGIIPMSMLGGGSGWEFDYTVTYVEVNGGGVSVEQEDGDTTTSPAGSSSWTGGGGDIFYTMSSLISGSQYYALVDPDGPPVSNWALGIHEGLAPDIRVEMSQVWRVDSDGNEIAMGDPSDDAREVGETMWYKFNYAFSILFITQAQQFTALNSLGQPFQTAESGEIEGHADIQVRLQETVFGEVEGEFMTATVIGCESNLDELMSGTYSFAVAPSASLTTTNTAVEIRDRVDDDKTYHCMMRFPFTLQNGLTRIDLGQNYLPADVWVQLTVVTELLLIEPLEIGDFGDDQEGGLPPSYSFPFDIRLVAIIGFGFLVLVVVLFFWSKSKTKPTVNVQA